MRLCMVNFIYFNFPRIYKLYKQILFYCAVIVIILTALPSPALSSQPNIEKMAQDISEKMSIKELLGQKIIIGPPWVLPETSEFYGKEKRTEKSIEILNTLIQDYQISNFIVSYINYKDWMAYQYKNRCLFNNKDFPRLNSEIIKNQNKLLKGKAESILRFKNTAFIFADMEGGRVQGLRGGGNTQHSKPYESCYD